MLLFIQKELVETWLWSQIEKHLLFNFANILVTLNQPKSVLYFVKCMRCLQNLYAICQTPCAKKVSHLVCANKSWWYWPQKYQRFWLNIGGSIFCLLLTTFEWSMFLRAAQSWLQIGLHLKSDHHVLLSSLIPDLDRYLSVSLCDQFFKQSKTIFFVFYGIL